MPERETVLVTGASGFIGSILVEMLARQGYRVLATDAQESSRTSRFTAIPGVEFHVLDLRHRDALAPVVAQADRIVHLAALRPAAASANPRTAFEVNVAATYDLIELAAHTMRQNRQEVTLRGWLDALPDEMPAHEQSLLGACRPT